MSTTPVYETGATSHAVNDLILFTDNTRELAELRDSIYKNVLGKFPKGIRRVTCNLGGRSVFDNGAYYGWHFEIKTQEDRLLYDMQKLMDAAITAYCKEFPSLEDHQHMLWINLPKGAKNEFCQLYANDFENWKLENNIK